MRVDLFDFDLPAELIALRPAKPRDSARLLLVDGGDISDRAVLDLPKLLRPGDTLVFNDTKVIPAQLEGRRGEARIGATLHKREGTREWWAFVRNAKRLRYDRVRGRRVRIRGRTERRRRHPSALLRRRTGRGASRSRGPDAAAALYRFAAVGG
jgi:S-adenosylmethionine:tRNA-ribosyltransferase-isomerase (queuine synthetase)